MAFLGTRDFTGLDHSHFANGRAATRLENSDRWGRDRRLVLPGPEPQRASDSAESSCAPAWPRRANRVWPPNCRTLPTMLTHIPSLAALESNDDSQLTSELRLARLRSQVAVIRSLADHVETLARPDDAHGLSAQIAEELCRLGRLLVQTAGALTDSPHLEHSGVFATKRSVRVDERAESSPVVSDPGARRQTDSP